MDDLLQKIHALLSSQAFMGGLGGGQQPQAPNGEASPAAPPPPPMQPAAPPPAQAKAPMVTEYGPHSTAEMMSRYGTNVARWPYAKFQEPWPTQGGAASQASDPAMISGLLDMLQKSAPRN